MKFIILTKETFLYVFVTGMILASISAWYILKTGDSIVFNQQSGQKARDIHMVADEIITKMEDGTEMAAYQWNPGKIYLNRGEKVNLYISGMNGLEHPFYIEGTSIKGTVKKGTEVMVPLQFNKEGTYRIICEIHSDKKHQGPMVGYVVVTK